jgi:alkylhydroperoxidase/carboxymuconolactone decarboxylase family protein YurZ
MAKAPPSARRDRIKARMAFYAGWPAAMSTVQVAYTVLVEGNKGE